MKSLIRTIAALACVAPVAVGAQSSARGASTSTAQGLLPTEPPERCTPAPAGIGTAASWVNRAAARVLPPMTDHRVLRFRAIHDRPAWEQSDRPYEPFLPGGSELIVWYDPTTDVLGRQSTSTPKVAQYPAQMVSATASFTGGDSLVPQPAWHPYLISDRLLNPWTVLLQWRARAADARIVQRCVYHDYPRVVLELDGARLYLSESDAIPIKYERVESHYLFGQVTAAYVWNTWWNVLGPRGGYGNDGLYPMASFRQFDGVTYERLGINGGAPQLVSADSAPRLTAPVVPAMHEMITLSGPAPDTVRVNDHTFQLVTPSYTETVTLQRDTIFLLDATSAESRGRQDSTWIARLFPGHHAMVLVVTDLAWPHISSVRYWVARGATIVSARTSESFLRMVVARHWTLAPDALERARASSPFRFRAVDDSLRLAGGAVVVHALRGNTTEGALAVWLPHDGFLWAGDYVQPTPASPYAADVVRTARALGIVPEWVGAQHMKLSHWADVAQKVPPDAPGAARAGGSGRD